MKKRFYAVICGVLCLVLVALGVFALSGCGTAAITATPTLLEKYANDNEGVYADVTEDFAEFPYVKGVYVMEVEDAHVELWNLDSNKNAWVWFKNNDANFDNITTSKTGSETETSGEYVYVVGGVHYNILFAGEYGIYAYGDKDAVVAAMKEINK